MPELRSCIEKLYLEVFPVPGIEDQLLSLPEGSHLGVTCSPRQGLQVTLELIDKLKGHTFHLVPHIAARQVRDRAHLVDIVQQLDDQGVQAMFVPGGDIDRALGDYDSSLALLRDLGEIGHRFQHVGVAAYPEGHPGIDDATLFTALHEKQALATYMVTQMCFDPVLLVKWLEGMRNQGITLPVWLGLPGVMDRMKLFRTAMRIGVGESARFARKQGALTGKLLRASHYSPDELVDKLRLAVENEALGIGGFYLFSFNQVQDTVAWTRHVVEQLSCDVAQERLKP